MGANDPIRTTTEPGSDLLVSAVTGSIGLTLADRTGGGILANPIIASSFIGKDRFLGALGAKMVDIAWGVDKYVAATEGNAFTVYDLASDAATVTPTRRGFARTASDMMRSFDTWGALDWAKFASESTVSWQQSVVSMFGGLASSITATGGNSGGAATWAHIVAAVRTLGIANVPGPYVLLTRPKDWGNVSADALALGGYIANDPETGMYKSAVNPGFKGVFLNGDLWVYTTNELTASGGDHLSMMFGAGFMGWNAHMPTPSPATRPLLWTPAFGVEIDRQALESEDDIVSSTHLGASIRQNAAGVQLPFLT
jgi:hypothetical protein